MLSLRILQKTDKFAFILYAKLVKQEIDKIGLKKEGA